MPSGVRRVLAAEGLKLRRRKTTFVVPVLLVAISVVATVGVHQAARRQWIGEATGFHVAASALQLLVNLVLLLVVVVSSFLVAREFGWGTAKSAWIRPLSRSDWVGGKLLFAAGLSSGMWIAVLVPVIALAAATAGFEDLMEKDYLLHPAGSLWGHLLLAAGLTQWSLWAVTVVAAALAALCGHPGGAVTAGVGLGLLMTLLSVFPGAEPFLLSTYVSMPWEQMIAMSKGLPLPHAWGDVFAMVFLGAGVWMVIAFALTMRTVRTREVN